jgi:hypothetical protein
METVRGETERGAIKTQLSRTRDGMEKLGVNADDALPWGVGHNRSRSSTDEIVSKPFEGIPTPISINDMRPPRLTLLKGAPLNQAV